MNKETLEQEARRLRELIYGPIADEKWVDPMKAHWVNDIMWLRRTARDQQHKHGDG